MNPESIASTREQPASSRPARRQRISPDVRDRFIRHAQSGATSISAAARAFGLSASTGHSIMQRMENGIIAGQTRQGQSQSKITADGLAAIAHWVDDRPDSTLAQLVGRLQEELGISVCKATISNAPIKIGFTVKLLRALPVSRNCPTTVLARKEYAQMFLSEAPPDRRQIVWVDECGFNLHIRRKYGRARIGQHAYVTVASNRGRNISVCAGMSEECFLYEDLRPGAFNADHFCAYLESLFLLLRRMDRGSCWIIMDNVRFHHCESVRACVRRHGHSLIFLPPYSPMLNPIESLFGKWKTLIRTQGVAMDQAILLEHIVVQSLVQSGSTVIHSPSLILFSLGSAFGSHTSDTSRHTRCPHR